MPSIRTVERLARRGFRPRMPKFIAVSWLPVPLFSGALTPWMRLSTTHGGCAGFGEILTADYVTRASMFKYVVFTRITQPVADHGQGIFFGAGAGSSVQLLFPSGFT